MGEVAEWSKALVSGTSLRARVPRNAPMNPVFITIFGHAQASLKPDVAENDGTLILTVDTQISIQNTIFPSPTALHYAMS